MLLTSVVLVLQETLEAAVLVSVLAALCLRLGGRVRWMPWGMAAGGVLAMLYAINMRAVSEWFDYVGQEIVNATLQALVAIALVMLARGMGALGRPAAPGQRGPRLTGLAALALALAVTREGSEILVYLGGFVGQEDKLPAVLVGGAIGFGIGASVGLLIFYGLFSLRGRAAVVVPLALLALFAGNMLAQSSLLLVQADLLPPGPTLWDSGAWLAEDSVPGRLAYALLGYESRPCLAQAIAFVTGAAAVLLSARAARRQA